jgi:PKD repeat protein
MKYQLVKKIVLIFCVIPLAINFTFAEAQNAFKPVRSITSTPKNNPETPIKVRIPQMSINTVLLEYQLPSPALSPIDYPGIANVSTHQDSEIARIKEINWHSLILGNAPLKSIAGTPTLPFVPLKLIIPFGHTLKSIRINWQNKVQLPNRYSIIPAQSTVILSKPASTGITLPKADIYQSSQPYPAEDYEFIGIQKCRGLSVLFINLFPVKYIPLAETIYYYPSFEIQIETEENINYTAGAELNYQPESLFSVRDWVENPEMIELAGYENRIAKKDRESYQMLIVTNNTIANATGTTNVQAFKNHKINLGISTVIATVEDIYAGTSGIDNAEKLRNYIKSKYNSWGLKYVLLLGDTAVVPHRLLYTEGLDEGNPMSDNIPSDVYFSCLDGNYNYDGDTKWGEPNDGEGGGDVDLLADIFVGRVLADNATYASNWIKKTMAFENDSFTSTYKKSNFMLGEYLGFGGVSDYAKDSLEQIVKGSSEHGYTTIGFAADSSFATKTMYAKDASWTTTQLKSEINANKHGFINHLGHASTSMVMKMYGSDVTGLANSKYFFVYSQGCYAGSFDSSECMAEYFTARAACAAFGVVYNGRYGFGVTYSTDGPSNRYHRQFWDAFFGEKKVILGQIHTDHHQDFIARINEDVMRWVFYETNLFADPSIAFAQTITADFTHTATNLQVQFTDTSQPGSNPINKWNWNFGDNSGSSTLKNPLYVYSLPGSYTVCLNIQDSAGLTGSICKTITVTSAGITEDLVGTFPGIGLWTMYSDSMNWIRWSLLEPAMIRCGDVNGNGKDDIGCFFDYSANPSKSNEFWLRSDNGAWSLMKVSADELICFDFGDINGDNQADLIGSWTFGLWWHNSATHVWQKLSGQSPTYLSSGDFDGDGLADIVGLFPDLKEIWIRYGNGTWVRISKNTTLSDLRCGDVDLDGKDEIFGSWDIGVWAFDPLTNSWTKHHADKAAEIAIGDMDGDGINDILGVWPSIPGLWVKYLGLGQWKKVSNNIPSTLTIGKFR